MIFNEMRDFLNTDFGILVSFISLISFIISALWKYYKLSKEALKKEKTKNILRDIFISAIYIIFGLIIPLLIIIGTWSSPFSITWLLLQILAWFVIISFVLLMHLLVKVFCLLKKVESEK